jgi:signal transduction histidine kinase
MRGRSALAAVVVVALALAVGAAAFVLVLQRELISTVQSDATARATEVAAQISSSGVEGLDADLSASRGTQLVQVLNGSGQVVSATNAQARVRPLSPLRPAAGKVRAVRSSRLPLLDDDDPYLVVVAGVRHQGTYYRVVVASPITAQQQSVRTALVFLLVGLPVLLLLVGAATWWLVGRALRPVERIRSRVGQIRGSAVRERIPVPSSGDEIERLAETMNEMLARVDRAQRTQRRFVADSSHELRSPLATLSASMELASSDTSGTTWSELAPVMSREIDRMSRLVEDLLLLAKVDEHGMRLTVEDVDLDDLVEAETRRLQAYTRLRVLPRIHPVRVSGDRARLQQAVTNLADNAARHARSVVRLAVEKHGDRARIIVEDDGPGVPPDERMRVFERFVRLDASRERGSGGSGLGLSIVQEIVHAHAGTVLITDVGPGGGRDGAGQGCRVVVELPQQDCQPPSGSSR